MELFYCRKIRQNSRARILFVGGRTRAINFCVGFPAFQLEPLEQRELLSVSSAVSAASTTRTARDRAGSTFAKARNAGILTGSKTFRDFVGAKDTVDFYKFKMTTQAVVDLNLTGASNKVKLALIQDKNGNGKLDRGETLAQKGGKSTSRFISKTLAPATYFVRVLQTSASNNYTLKLTAHRSDAGNTLADALKVNSPSGNLFFTETVGGEGDPVDFYRISFTQSTHLILAMGNLSANADLTLIQDGNGNGEVDAGEILDSSNNADTQNEGITWHSAPGTYFIRVTPAAAAPATYTLQFVTFPMA